MVKRIMSLREKLNAIFNRTRHRKSAEPTDPALIERVAARLRSVDPETKVQWLRLMRSLESAPSAARHARVAWVPRLAALGVLVAGLLAGWYFVLRPLSESTERFVTDRGEQLQVVLPDSTVVMLNYATELTVQKFQPGQARHLTLRGEALFRVRNNATPFIVSTDVAEVRVTGTEFNVRVRDGLAEIAVLRGAVAVTAQDSTLGLTVHQMAVCGKGSVPRHAGTLPSPEYPGWLDGKLFLHRTSFAAACRELELRFDIEIRLDDPKLRDEQISGVLDVRTPQSALTALCGLAGKRFRLEGESYSIY